MKESNDKLAERDDKFSFGEIVTRAALLVLLVCALPIYMVVRVTGQLIKSLKGKDA